MPTDLEPDVHNTVNARAVAVVIKKQENLVSLLSTGVATARMHHGVLTAFLVSQSEETPDWFFLPADYDSADIVVQSITGKNCVRLLIKQLAALKPLLLGMALDDTEGEDRYLVGRALAPVLQQMNCPVYIVKSAADWSLPESLSAFVPFYDDANTRFAITTVLNVSPELRVTAAKVVAPTANEHEKLMQREELRKQTETWAENKRFQTKLINGFDEQQSLL